MTTQITVQGELAERLVAQAQASGLSVDEILRAALNAYPPLPESASASGSSRPEVSPVNGAGSPAGLPFSQP